MKIQYCHPEMNTLPKVVLLVLILSSWYSWQSCAQEDRFFMPLEIRRAYDKGTRSYDGRPGPEYWQNYVKYRIAVSVDPYENKISGRMVASFYNKSPDKLNWLVLMRHLNVYKKGAVRKVPTHGDNIGRGTEIKTIIINQDTLDLGNRSRVQRWNTHFRLFLPHALESQDSLELHCNWQTWLPVRNVMQHRMGVVDSSNIFVAYWYPQIAVYDDIFSWDQIKYDLLNEFHNNLAEFQVEITVPEGYITWGTGVLQNPESVLSPGLLSSYRKAWISDSIFPLITPDNLPDTYPEAATTWSYQARNVTDFAFAVASGHLWKASSVDLGNRRVLVNVIYPADSLIDHSVAMNTLRTGMKYFSETMPGIPYPFETFSNFITGNGVSGMEYPMIARNGNSDLETTLHELFHMYFPMYVRTNERRWAWMDEGWAEFNTCMAMQYAFDDAEKWYPPSNHLFGSIHDLPLITSSEFGSPESMPHLYYNVPAEVLRLLHDHLGENLFMHCYREYIRRWAGKSPTPYDFFFTFEDAAGEDLSWIWKPWFFEFGAPDLAIENINDEKLSIRNLGNKPVGIHLLLEYADEENDTIVAPASVWRERHEYPVSLKGKLISATLNPYTADQNVKNNFHPALSMTPDDRAYGRNTYAGIYEAPWGSLVDLFYQDDLLMLRFRPGTMVTFKPEADLQYVGISNPMFFIRFIKHDNGQVQGFRYTGPLGGNELEFKKIR